MSPEKLRDLTRTIIKAYESGLIYVNGTADDSISIWNYYNSIFFAVTVVTTIGNLQPSNHDNILSSLNHLRLHPVGRSNSYYHTKLFYGSLQTVT